MPRCVCAFFTCVCVCVFLTAAAEFSQFVRHAANFAILTSGFVSRHFRKTDLTDY